jgi:hypothetical protein
MFARAMQEGVHPILAQIVPIRRCNLDCAYCNEYDKVSDPVPLDAMLRRIDKLAELGCSIVTLSGGEPTLHPQLDAIIARIRERGAIATLITNGLLLTPERIQKLNVAGLDYLQISIDNVQPDDTSKKSLRVLDRKLEWLAEHAEFGVTINSVLGAGIRNPEDAYTIGSRARGLGFHSTLGILHDHFRATRAAHAGAPGRLPAFPRPRLFAVFLPPLRSFSGEHQPRTPQPVALPGRRALPLYLRGRPGALLFPAARAPRHPARIVYAG